MAKRSKCSTTCEQTGKVDLRISTVEFEESSGEGKRAVSKKAYQGFEVIQIE